jgi:hypothetical protein
LLFERKYEKKNLLFSKLDAAQTGINFVNEEKRWGYEYIQISQFYNGGGVAIGDINNDGLSDIYFTSNLGTNKLYLNKGLNLKIFKKAGIEGTKVWSTGVVMVDLNGDIIRYLCL